MPQAAVLPKGKLKEQARSGTGMDPGRRVSTSGRLEYHILASKVIQVPADNPPMNETDLLAVHRQEPLSARWFGLASYCLQSGCNVVTYDAHHFRAEVADGQAAGPLTGFFEATVQEDGRARWTWGWTDDDAPVPAELEKEVGVSESWTQVLSDWRHRAFQG
jgi:hypothetical protein